MTQSVRQTVVKARIGEDSRAGALMLAGTRLKPDRAGLRDAMDGELAAEHRFVLPELMVRGENLNAASADSTAISWSKLRTTGARSRQGRLFPTPTHTPSAPPYRGSSPVKTLAWSNWSIAHPRRWVSAGPRTGRSESADPGE